MINKHKRYNSGIRFEVGSQECGLCQTRDNIIQFERNIIRKKLSIIEIAFLCKNCANKNDLIRDSTELEKMEKE